MEDLTKQQIVLLTLFVSFVTSIATGIVTVALLDQAPPGMTQTINRVVERTIEKVVQVPAQSAAVVTKETIVMKEDDRVMEAVAKGESVIIRIIVESGDGSSEVVGLGISVSKDGLIATDSELIGRAKEFKAKLSDGKIYPISLVLHYDQGDFAIFQIKPEGGEVNTIPATLGDSGKLKLGQAIVMVGGKNSTRVETGIVSGFTEKTLDSQTASTTNETKRHSITSIITDIRSDNATRGDLLLNLSADIVGIRLYRNKEWIILPISGIQEALEKYSQKVRLEGGESVI